MKMPLTPQELQHLIHTDKRLQRMQVGVALKYVLLNTIVEHPQR